MNSVICTLGISLLILLVSGCASRTVVIEKRPPAPPLKVEIRPAKPYPRAVWIPGHWKWNRKRGVYVWISGHWTRW